ncbi:MAG: FeoB-associated Cys-rich membrane protein [Caldisericia bacterium]|nr:FeoB-associated Cys-rich membrane protein [Caldisericia bacterium]
MIERIIIGTVVLSAFVYIVMSLVKAIKDKDPTKHCSSCCSKCNSICTDEKNEKSNG